MVAQTPEIFRFGEFELNVDSGELRRNNQRLKLQRSPSSCSCSSYGVPATW